VIEGEHESAVSAGERELLEETGYKASNMIQLIDTAPSAGLCAEIQTIVRAYDVMHVAAGGGDDDENIRVHVVPLCVIGKWLTNKQQEGFIIATSVFAGLYFATK